MGVDECRDENTSCLGAPQTQRFLDLGLHDSSCLTATYRESASPPRKNLLETLRVAATHIQSLKEVGVVVYAREMGGNLLQACPNRSRKLERRIPN